MGSRRKDDVEPLKRRRPSATTPEKREQQLVAKAYDLAEQQIEAGTASSQVITQFLKMGSESERTAREKMKIDTELQKAKIEAIASAGRVEELYKDAIVAMREYAGHEPLPMPEYDYED